MRERFNELLGEWEHCVVLRDGPRDNVGDDVGDNVVICSGGQIIREFNLGALRQTMSPEHYAIVETLLSALDRQAMAAGVASIVACADLDLQQKKAQGAAKGGRASARPVRPKVEKLMRAARGRGEDPRVYFGAWAEEYGYSRTQLRNILRAVNIS